MPDEPHGRWGRVPIGAKLPGMQIWKKKQQKMFILVTQTSIALSVILQPLNNSFMVVTLQMFLIHFWNILKSTGIVVKEFLQNFRKFSNFLERALQTLCALNIYTWMECIDNSARQTRCLSKLQVYIFCREAVGIHEQDFKKM